MSFANNIVFDFILMSLGFLILVVGLTLVDRKRFLVAMFLAGLVVLTGFVRAISNGVRQSSYRSQMMRLRDQQRRLTPSSIPGNLSPAVNPSALSPTTQTPPAAIPSPLPPRPARPQKK